MTKILSYSDLQKKGLKLAKIVANRQVSDKNVEEKMADMRRIGAIETAKVVKATEAIKEGLAIVDFSNQTMVIDEKMAKKYVAILDGQNRATAHLLLSAERGEDGQPTYNKEMWFEFLPEERPYTIMEFICRANAPDHTWTLNDYAHGASELHKDFPTLSYITSLVDDGFSFSAAAKCATLNRKITPSMIREAVSNPNAVDPQFAVETNLEDGKRLVDAARKTLPFKVVKIRTFPDWVIEQIADKESVDSLEKFFLQITDEQAAELGNIKGINNVASKEMLLKSKLSEFYKQMAKA